MFLSDNLEQCVQDLEITSVSCTLFLSILIVRRMKYFMSVSLKFTPNSRQVIAKAIKSTYLAILNWAKQLVRFIKRESPEMKPMLNLVVSKP